MKQFYEKPTAVAVELSFEEHIATSGTQEETPITSCVIMRNNQEGCDEIPGTGTGWYEGR